jgi:hypothetical protein
MQMQQIKQLAGLQRKMREAERSVLDGPVPTDCRPVQQTIEIFNAKVSIAMQACAHLAHQRLSK